MNRRRSEPQRSNFPLFLALAIFALVGITGGAMHAIYRNGQIKLERQITDARKRIEGYRSDIQLIQVRKERMLDRYEIRDQVASVGLPLVTVPHDCMEKVRPEPEPMPVVLRP
jgi:hypothetical protein